MSYNTSLLLQVTSQPPIHDVNAVATSVVVEVRIYPCAGSPTFVTRSDVIPPAVDEALASMVSPIFGELLKEHRAQLDELGKPPKGS